MSLSQREEQRWAPVAAATTASACAELAPAGGLRRPMWDMKPWRGRGLYFFMSSPARSIAWPASLIFSAV